MHMLQDGSQALQAHASVYTWRRQVIQAAVSLHVELHEHVVPDFNEAVTVFTGAAGWAAGDVLAMVIKNLAARPARAGVSHHPEVVRRVFFALVVANAHNAVGGQANLVVPDVVGLLVVNVDGGQQLFRRQFVDFGQQFPTPQQRIAFEVIAKAPVAQHFKERMVPRGVAHVFQVVVFAARPQAGLDAGSPHVAAFVGTQKHVLELHHARVGKHQRRIITRHQR